MARVRVLTILAAMAVGMISAAMSNAVAQDSKPDWREQNAYTLGVQAYLYAFPVGLHAGSKVVADRGA